MSGTAYVCISLSITSVFLLDLIVRDFNSGYYNPVVSIKVAMRNGFIAPPKENPMTVNAPIGMLQERGQINLAKATASKALLYYNSKVNAKPLSIKLPPFLPKTTTYEYFGYHVTVTN